MRIYKYKLPLSGVPFAVSMSQGAKLLSAQMQNGFPVLWAEVTDDEPELRRFQWFGTGHEVEFASGLPETRIKGYIATVQVSTALVLHLYELQALPSPVVG